MRRDVETALLLKLSPKQLYGWLPRTFYHYNDDGTVAYTVTESGWGDPYERATVDAYLDWKADLHVCGRPMSEALKDAQPGIDEESYRSGYRTCYACMALEYERAGTAHGDKDLRERGIDPESWRLWHVELKPEAAALLAAQSKT